MSEQELADYVNAEIQQGIKEAIERLAKKDIYIEIDSNWSLYVTIKTAQPAAKLLEEDYETK